MPLLVKDRLEYAVGDLTPEAAIFIHRLGQMFEAEKGRTMDANESLALVRSLTQFSNEVYSVLLTPELKFNQVLPMVPNRAARGVKKFGWYTMEEIGKFQFLANGASDLENLGMDVNEKIVDIKLAGARITWSWEDIDAAIYLGKNLPADMGMVARAAADRTHDEVTAKGNTKYKLNGLLSEQTSMTAYGSITWSTMTDIKDKVAAVQSVARRVSTATNHTLSAGMILLPPAYYEELEDTPFGDNSDKTALTYLEDTYRRRGLQIVNWYQFKAVTLETLTNKDVIMAYPFSLIAGENAIIDPFFMKPPKEDENYNVGSGCFLKTAGVIKRQPKAFVYGTLD